MHSPETPTGVQKRKTIVAKHAVKEEKRRKEIVQKLLEHFGNPYRYHSIDHTKRERALENTATKIMRVTFNSKSETEISLMREEILALLEELDIEVKTSTKPRNKKC